MSGSQLALLICEAVQRAVELAVAAAVQAVAAGVARGGGDRRGAAGARELGVGGEAVGAGDLTDQLRGGQRTAASLGEQLRRVALDQGGELCLQLANPGRARGDLTHELARDPHARRLLGASEAAGDLPQPLAGVQRPGRDLELGPEVVQMPAQPLLVGGACRDQILAMVDQQANAAGRAEAAAAPGDEVSWPARPARAPSRRGPLARPRPSRRRRA